MVAAARSRGSRRRATMATRAPSAASRRAIAKPMPWLAPPTIATLPFSARSMCQMSRKVDAGDPGVAGEAGVAGDAGNAADTGALKVVLTRG